MRRHDDVVEREQRPVVRLRREDVESGAGELAGLECLDERLLVDQRPAGGIDDACAVLHLRDRLAVDHPARLVGERRMEREEVRRREHLVLGLGVVDAEVAEAVVGDERVVGDDRHPEADRAPRDLLADPAEAEDAERLALELHPAPASSAPSGPASAPRAPAGCCARARRGARRSAPPPRRPSTRARSRRRSRAGSPPRRRRCRRPRLRGRSPSGSSPARSVRPSASSRSGSRSRRSRR